MKNLTFLTVTSGHSQVNDRAAVKQFAVSSLVRLVQQGGGPVPGLPGWSFRLTLLPGGAFFSVSNGADIVAAGGVAYTEASAATLWPELEKMHLVNYDGLMKLSGGLAKMPANWLGTPERPKSLPWLAVVLQPGLARHPFAGAWLGDFEQCLAWTVIEVGSPNAN